MLSNVGNSLRPGGDINQYTLKALSASYKDLGTVYRTLEKVSDDEDTGEDDALEKILTDLGGALGHLETAVQLMKEHEGVVPMADDKKSKGGIFDEAGDYRNRCHRKLRQVIKSLKGWRKQ